MSDDGKNPFGGGNPHGLYVPMSEDEQEVLVRLVETKDVVLIIHGWAKMPNPKIKVGDLRVSVEFVLNFSGGGPAPKKIYYLDLELQTGSGYTLAKNRLPTLYSNKPVEVVNGTSLAFAWDIAIHHMDPALVKMLKPGAIGLTSRRLDKDSKDATLTGNMRLDDAKRAMLTEIRSGEKAVAADTAAELKKAGG